MRLGWDRDDVTLFFSCPDAAQHECREPEPILLCMGLFSRFCVQAPAAVDPGRATDMRLPRAQLNFGDEKNPGRDRGSSREEIWKTKSKSPGEGASQRLAGQPHTIRTAIDGGVVLAAKIVVDILQSAEQSLGKCVLDAGPDGKPDIGCADTARR